MGMIPGGYHERAAALAHVGLHELGEVQLDAGCAIAQVRGRVRGVGVNDGVRGHDAVHEHVVLDGRVVGAHRREGCGHRVKGRLPQAAHRGHDGRRALELLVHLHNEDGKRRVGRRRLELPARVAAAPARPARAGEGTRRGLARTRGEPAGQPPASCGCSDSRPTHLTAPWPRCESA
jgi:hypothetical protein